MPRSAAALLALSLCLLAACGRPTTLVEKSYFASNDYWVVIVNRSALKDSGELAPVAREMCKGKEACLVGMWFDARQAPNFVPVDAQQRRDQIFAYGWREVTKVEYLQWNCAVFPERTKTDECMPVALNR